MSLAGAPPGLSADLLLLLRYGIPIALAVVLPFLGVVIAGTALSLFLNASGREHGDAQTVRLSRDLMRSVTIGPGVVFVAGLLPLPFVALAQRLLAPSAPLSWNAWIPVFALLLAGCALVSVYRHTILRSTDVARMPMLGGTAGLIALFSGSYLLFTLLGTLFNPSKMPLFRYNAVFFLSWNSFVEFFLFLALSFGLTGGVVLWAVGRAPKADAEADAAYREYAQAVGASFARTFSLFLPVLVLLSLLSLPSTALSGEGFAAAAVILLLSPAVFLLLPRTAESRPERKGGPVTLLYVLMFFAVVAGWTASAAHAFFGRPLPFLVSEAATLISEGRIVPTTPPTEATLAQGKKVFQTICTTCHRFDKRLIGPPFEEVLPRYRGDAERLKDFVRDPVKTNSGYPHMPRLGLTESQLDAVAHYVLHRVEQPAAAKPRVAPGGVLREGEKVFEESCRSCHLFDRRLLGPALDKVVPKYRGDLKRLKDFIREPVKVDPAYPLMPPLRLDEKQIDAVARYILGTAGKER